MATPAHTLFLALLKLTGRRRKFLSAAGLHARIARERRSMRPDPPPALRRRVRIEEQACGGHRCFTVRPLLAQATGPVQVLFLHGGAYVSEMTPYHWRFVAGLVEAAGCTVHVPIYPLAPEHTHRDAYPVIERAWQMLGASTPSQHRVLMGDSAGGGLALGFAQTLAAGGQPGARDVVLISPWLDLALRNPAIVGFEARDPWLARPGLLEAGRLWAGGDDTALPRLSPLHGPLAGLGRLTVFIGTRDLLLPDCRRLRDLAAQAGVPCDLIEGAGMIHDWPILPVPDALAARQAIARRVAAAS
jgi:monoterpene epsilon-lactone hydrolase